MKQIIFLLLIALIAGSCRKPDEPGGTLDNEGTLFRGDGVFIINEGNYTWGNGSISYFSYDSSKLMNDLFQKINGRPLGDVPNSMVIYDAYAYIVVNNSGKVEVVKSKSLESVATVTGLKSPRSIAVVDNNKAYVSNLYSDSLTIINLKNYTISGYINIRRTSESILLTGKKAFVSNWYGGNEIVVVNTDLDKMIDSIVVGKEPESMVIDNKYTLWVLCNGGWMRENFAELVGINVQTNEVKKRLIFPSILDSPSCLRTDGDGDTLYFLEKGIKRMNIDEIILPEEPFVTEGSRVFYNLGINPVNGDIFVTDVVDYQQNGFVLKYDNKGFSETVYQAGIIPSSMCFKINPPIVTN
jgi:DNA-binding beta-propeller fold protein YncE